MVIVAKYDNRNISTDNDLKQEIHDVQPMEKIYPKEKTVQDLFESQAAESPAQIAAVYLDQRITYFELNQRANQIARKLRECGVKSNNIVGLMVARSIDMLVGIMAILKAGGCYLPIDPAYPEARIHYMLQDSATGILLTQKQFRGMNFNGHLFCLDEEALYTGDGSNLNNVNTSTDLAYVIYTSGSTGKPKGVMVEHRGVYNFIIGVTDQINFTPGKSIVCLTTISFDIFVLESLLPLSQGMKIIIADPMQLSNYLDNERVDMLQTTPSTMQLILNDTSNLKYVRGLSEIMVGGEAFPKRLLEKLKKHTGARIYNMYGPTETTVWSTIKELTGAEEITIGKPIANTQIYVIDEHNQPLNADFTGELCIGGHGLARGYLNRTELTKEKFINNPAIQGQRIYKTGDLAKWLPNGEVFFLGRNDNQVKIRGFRIELEEIEDCLNQHEKIKDSLVVPKNNEDGIPFLVGYYIADEELSISELISFLRNQLPEYMIPGFYIRIEKIPLTPNYKIDKKSLPDPDNKRPNLAAQYMEPETEIEKQIVDIWKKVLNRNLVGINDNFFELGGNSILVSHLFVELGKYYPGKLNVVDVFSYPTVAKLAGFLSEKKPLPGLSPENRNPNETSFSHPAADPKKALSTFASGVTGVGTEAKGLSFLEFPTDYLDSDNPKTIFIASLAKEILKSANRVSFIHQVKVSSIFLAVYFYCLHDITKQDRITIYILAREKDFRSMEVNLADIEDLSILIRKVDEYSFGTIAFSAEPPSHGWKPDHCVLPVFCGEDVPARFLPGNRELFIQITDLREAYSIKLEFHYLSKSKMEEMFQNYLKVIHYIL